MSLARALGLLMAALVAWSFPAAAHLTPNSEITLTIGADQVAADIIVPLGEYGFATGNPTSNDTASLAQARRYLARHIAVTAPDGRAWSIALRDVEFVQIAGPPDLHATARLIPPPGASPRKFSIEWSALLDRLPGHFALFVLAGDSGGMVGEGREVLGAVRASDTTLTVDRGAPSGWVTLVNAMLLGIDHIVGGYDHLLFLLALLLPAPLIARAGRWRNPQSVRETVWQLLRVVTAFTIGHSLTLIAATLGGWSLPAAPVEIAIAVSVLVSAIHAIRPLFPGQEPYIALGFGLVHGLAFATLLHNAGAGAAGTAISLLGFNLGIEVVQLAVVALVVPPFVMLSRTAIFRPIRVTLGWLMAIAAASWVVNRGLGWGEALVGAIETVVAHGLWAVALLYLLAVTQAVRARSITKLS